MIQPLSLILIAILTASTIGVDYGAGTLRSVLTQGTGRWPYLAAKLLTLAVLTALGLLVAVVSVAVGSAIANAIGGAAPATIASAATWPEAGLALWKAWVSILPYIALTALVTIFARSSAAGMAIGLGYYFGEQLAVVLLSSLFSGFQNVADYLLVRNISGWTGSALVGSAAALPDELRAVVVLTIYTLAFAGVAFSLFERRDVQGPAGGG